MRHGVDGMFRLGIEKRVGSLTFLEGSAEPTTGPRDHQRSRQKVMILGCSTFDSEMEGRYDKICGQKGWRTRLKSVNEMAGERMDV